ncbi:hypothetical protein ACQP2Y_26990 [Actinoplanes sp. CA-051413]|uniref:hypothetical protein n=1 Tax=Actinoplanes sp. CA-051413 TaxID=3239899 RepID=UPI003D96D5A3
MLDAMPSGQDQIKIGHVRHAAQPIQITVVRVWTAAGPQVWPSVGRSSTLQVRLLPPRQADRASRRQPPLGHVDSRQRALSAADPDVWFWQV